MRRDATMPSISRGSCCVTVACPVSNFRRQVPIGPYIADFVSFSRRVIVEVDGGQHAESKGDLRRDQWFSNEDFKIIRYWNHDVCNPEGVLTDLLTHLNQS